MIPRDELQRLAKVVEVPGVSREPLNPMLKGDARNGREKSLRSG